MSTAHRILDGDEYEGRTKIGRRIRRWKHPNKEYRKYYLQSITYQSPKCSMGRERVLQTMFGCINYLRNYVMSIHLDMVRYIPLIFTQRFTYRHHLQISKGWFDRRYANHKDGMKLMQIVIKPDSVDAYRTYYIQEKKICKVD